MKDYIEREAAIEAMGSLLRQHFLCVPDSIAQAAATAGYMDGVKDADIRLRSIPAADVRPVVLCRDCKHSAIDLENTRYCKCVTYYNHVPDDWFCADGERWP